MPACSPMRLACLCREKIFVDLFCSASAVSQGATVLYMECPIIMHVQDERMAGPSGDSRLTIGAMGRDDMDECLLCNKP